MTIEIADRLIKLRKKYGYSQEELADKLGLSRQAVSKWERAEASPDTDNLICLAKIYGVSLDELLATDEDVDTIVEEQVKDKEEEKKESETNIDDRVVINDKGVFLKSKDGSSVTIDNKGIHCVKADGTVVDKKQDPVMAIIGAFEGLLFTLATVAYILLGSLLGMWHNAWVVFFIPEILASLARAIRKKNAQHFNMAFVSLFVFFFVCMVIPGLDTNLWHPMWVVFLAIPVYHTSVEAINKLIGKKDEDKNVFDNEVDDDDEDDD